MLDSATILATLQRAGVSLFTGVPDSLLKDFCGYVNDSLPASQHIIAANEGAALAIAAGWQMTQGGTPLVYLQNSGLGNLVNPLTSLVDPKVYAIPVLLLIGWRGEPGVPDEPQHIQQGAITPGMLDCMEIPHFVLPKEAEAAEEAIQKAVHTANQRSGPVALLVQKDSFQKYKLSKVSNNPYTTAREEAIKSLLQSLPSDGILVSTTGMISREVYENRVNAGGLKADFLTVGCMGHASQIALGAALAKPDKQVTCVDGDGALLMHLGSLSLIGAQQPANYLHIVLNNGAHDSVGGQDTVGFKVDFPTMALASGYKTAAVVTELNQINTALSVVSTPGPHFLEIRVSRGSRADLGRPKSSPLQNKLAFQANL